jgi:hypothetical protein
MKRSHVPTTMLNTFWSFKRNYIEHGLD